MNVVSSASRALPLFPRFLTERCVARSAIQLPLLPLPDAVSDHTLATAESAVVAEAIPQ